MGKRVDKRRHHKVSTFWYYWGSLVVYLIYCFVLICVYMVQTCVVSFGFPMDYDDSTGMVLEEEIPISHVTPEAITVEAQVDRGGFTRTKVTPEIDLRTPSGISASGLQNCVSGVFSGLSGTFTQAEDESGVNALFLVATAAYESSWGTSELAESHNNLFGWTDKSSSSGYMTFESKEACILYVADKLSKNYLSPDGCYFNGYTITDVNKRYCTGGDWGSEVAKIMHELEEGYNAKNVSNR